MMRNRVLMIFALAGSLSVLAGGPAGKLHMLNALNDTAEERLADESLSARLSRVRAFSWTRGALCSALECHFNEGTRSYEKELPWVGDADGYARSAA
jgi:hypothetical protein